MVSETGGSSERRARVSNPANRLLQLWRSIGIRRDDLAGVLGPQRVVDAGGDRLLEEPDRSVAENEVRPAGVIALEPVVDGLVPPAVESLGEVVELAEIAGCAVGSIDLTVLEFGLPVQGDDRRCPDAITIDPGEGSVHVGRRFPGENRVACSIGDLSQRG